MTARASRPAPGSDRGIAGRRGQSRVEELARFVCRSRWEQISEPAREQLKLRVLDSLGVALGALDGRAGGDGPRAGPRSSAARRSAR